MEQQQSHNLKVLRKCVSDLEAQMIVDLLQANGINAIIDSSLPHSVLPVSDDAVVLIREEDYEQALKICNAIEKDKKDIDFESNQS